jgi:hypothetical protein
MHEASYYVMNGRCSQEPGFFVRDRPDRACLRKTSKAGDFPARKPGEPSVTNVTRRIGFHLLYPGRSPESKAH